MIVKNEARPIPSDPSMLVIERSLRSAIRAGITSYVIVDTGSTDTTIDTIRKEMVDIPGRIICRPWIDFGSNRTEACALAREEYDGYLLLIDADEIIVGKLPDTADSDCISIIRRRIDRRDFVFYRPTIVSAKKPWYWKGRVHEYLTCDEPYTRSQSDAFEVIEEFIDEDPKAKYESYVALLSSGDSDDMRTTFYLAESLRALGRKDEAVAAYQRRIAQGGWAEERFYSALQLYSLTGEIIWLTDAIRLCPERACEALVALAMHFRRRNEHHMGNVFAREAFTHIAPSPKAILFIDRGAYLWRNADEHYVCSFYTNDIHGMRDASMRLREAINEGMIPSKEIERIKRNLALYGPA